MSRLAHFFWPHSSNNQRAKLLHPSALSIVVGLFVVFQLGVGFFSRTFPQILGYAANIPPEEIVRLTNAQRSSQGLGAVTLDPQLSAAAAQKASDMFANNYWAHISPSGTQPWFFVTQSGYSYRYAGENLARDFSDASSVVNAWMNSPSHKENLLSNKYQDIGVAVVDGVLEGRETTLVVQMFGTKISAAPSVTAGLNSIAVSAAEPTVIPTFVPTPQVVANQIPDAVLPVLVASEASISPFAISKVVSLVLIAVIIGVLAIDVIYVKKKRITRWTSKSMAHLAFMIFLLLAAAAVYSGQIL